RLHSAVAEVLQQLFADRSDEMAALLAHHWERAGDALAAARCHRRAANWAGVSDIAEAMRHSQKVGELAAGLPESREVLELRLWAALRRLDLGWRAGMSRSQATRLFEEGRATAHQLEDTRSLAMLIDTYGIVVGMSGDVDGG